MTFKKIALLFTALFSSSVFAIDADPLIQYLPYGSHASLLVTPLGSQKPLLEHDAHKMMLPASTEKVVTALAASLYLGSNYQFTTTLKYTGQIKGNKVIGDVILHFSGDPTLTRKHLEALFAELKRKGVNHISGNFVIDSRTFEGHDRANGWAWNNLTACYNAPPSAIVIDRNCFIAQIKPNAKIGAFASVNIAAKYHVNMKSEAMTIPQKSDNKYCELNVSTNDNNAYLLTGCIKQQGKKNTGISLNFAIQDSLFYGKSVIRDLLQANGIKVNGKIVNNAPIYKKTTNIAEHRSAPLSSLLQTMLLKSDNLIADTIFRTLGWKFYGTGTWLASSDAVKTILKQKAHIDLGNTVIEDGSGLSRKNAITAEKMMEILQYIASHDQSLHIIDMLPVSGKSGSLTHRPSVSGEETVDCIKAKTGFIDGVYNLAGFIETKNGRKMAFVQFVNGYSMDTKSGAKRDKQMKFEKSLYRVLCSL